MPTRANKKELAFWKKVKTTNGLQRLWEFSFTKNVEGGQATKKEETWHFQKNKKEGVKSWL